MNTAEPDQIPNRIHAIPVRYPWRIVSAVVVTIIAAMFLHGLVTNKVLQWDLVGQYLFHQNILRAIGWTLILTVAAMVLSIIMALTLAIMRSSENPVMRNVAWVYIWFFRGTPVYTQLVFWGMLSVLYPVLSLGIPFGPEFFSFETKALTVGTLAAIPAILGLAFNEAAYLAEIIRAGLQSVDPGQHEAARALGMKNGAIMRRVVIPQAMRVIVPPTGNETISMLKTTSLVLAVPFTLDLTYQASAIGSRTFAPVPLLVVAAIWYLVITSILMVGQYYLERYYGRGFDGRSAASSEISVPRRARKQKAINAAHTTPDPSPLDESGT
ncbi:amino acid ABC transporter permease [Rarobacter faecitabidus]|uniref:Polar amino acid transport system permease protein n=1 Tax=Rarobacter faecitabidus TaxID=13243 RepID=A0A542ZPJ8_RARFA|nr:amino acid ABC transporter permease [Rarobacter faecitabidus]TQL62159.1 polar amino acid transport system permease protein [Rarobacter faecitabidus]